MTATYRRALADTSSRRAYTITLGLDPYAADIGADQAAIIARVAAGLWIRDRMAAGKPFLTFRVTRCDLLYGRPGEDGQPQGEVEPALLFDGDVSVLYGADIRDGEVMEMLDELASALAGPLLQERVYLTYRATAWVLERVAEGSDG